MWVAVNRIKFDALEPGTLLRQSHLTCRRNTIFFFDKHVEERLKRHRQGYRFYKEKNRKEKEAGECIGAEVRLRHLQNNIKTAVSK